MKQFGVALLLMLGTAGAAAHGPTPRKVEQTVSIGVPAETVWALVGAFESLDAWHPLVAASTGEDGNEVGALRVIELESGGQIVDSLDEYDAAGRSYTYRLAEENVEAFPVSSYSATFTVKPVGTERSDVIWKASFYRADTGNYPPENRDDAAATAAMEEFFRTGLEGLKSMMEAHNKD